MNAGDAPSTLTQVLLTHQAIDGGFGDRPGYQSTVLDTAYALEAFVLSGFSGAIALCLQPREHGLKIVLIPSCSGSLVFNLFGSDSPQLAAYQTRPDTPELAPWSGFITLLFMNFIIYHCNAKSQRASIFSIKLFIQNLGRLIATRTPSSLN